MDTDIKHNNEASGVDTNIKHNIEASTDTKTSNITMRQVQIQTSNSNETGADTNIKHNYRVDCQVSLPGENKL